MVFPNKEIIGVILLGGQSLRMGTPKALLPYKEMFLYEYMAKKLQSVCTDVYLSCNSKNLILDDPIFPLIEDNYAHHGPISGILSSLEYLETPVFILPCDTPLLSIEALKQIFEKRNPDQICTVFYNEKNTTYEPLIGIWEISSIPVLKEAIQKGDYSLQKILKENNVDKNPIHDLDQFKNVNTIVDFETIQKTR